MASVKLPQATFSEAPRTKQRDPQTEQILRIMGNNPIAGGINQVTPDIADALARRAKIKRETEQAALFAKAGGLNNANGLTDTSLIGTLLQLKDKQADRAAAAAKAREEMYTADEIRGMTSGSINAFFAANPNGISKDKLSLFSTVQNRRGLDLDRDESRALRATLGGAQLDAREKDRYRNYILDMEQRDPVIKELNKQQISFDQVEAITRLVESGNTIAANALGAKVARSVGEVGVMTDTDVTRYVTSGKMSRGTADKFMKMMRGVPTEATLNEIGQINAALKDVFEKKVQPRYDGYIDSYSSIEGISPTEFSNKIKIRYRGQSANGAESNEQRKARLIQELKGARK